MRRPTTETSHPFPAASRRRQLRLSATAVLLVLLSPAVTAAEVAPIAEPEARRLSFDFFGTLGLVHSSQERADFVWLPTRPDGPGRSQAVSWKADSILGGQVTYQATPKLSALVQVVVQQTHDDEFTPQLEWASVRYDVTPRLSLRAGRLAVPAFMVSEYRKVSYANPWVRPPVELYGLIPLFTIDGVAGSHRTHAGDWTTTLDASIGRSRADLARAPGSVDATKAWNVNATVQRGDFTGRAAVAGGELTIEAFAPLFDAFRGFGSEGEAIADRYDVDGRDFRFASIGAEYEPRPWFAFAELGWNDTDSVLGERIAGHVTAGYRAGRLSPYASYSRSRLLSEGSADGLSLTGLPPGAQAAATALNDNLTRQLRTTVEQQTFALGARWELVTGLALKLQLDFVDPLGDSPGTFVNRAPDFEAQSARVVTFATVFVF